MMSDIQIQNLSILVYDVIEGFLLILKVMSPELRYLILQ